MRASGRLFAGQTPEQRAAARRGRLLEAALELLGDQGWDAVTMTAVCRRAGLTERYFYESFRDREDLHVALIDQVAAELEEAVLAVLRDEDEDATPAGRIRAAAQAVLGVMLGDPRKGRVALLEGVGSARVQQRRADALHGFEELLRADAVRLSAGRPDDAAAQLAAIALVGALSELVSRRLSGQLDIADDDLVAFIVDMVQAVLR